MKIINSETETSRIVHFIQNVLKKAGVKDIVIGWSGGIDSTVCLYLLAKALSPENIHVLHMPYTHSSINELTLLRPSASSGLRGARRINGLKIHEISIKKAVDTLWKTLRGNYRLDSRLRGNDKEDHGNDEECLESNKVRLGNIMARVRMIMLFDFAKKVKGLVCGTENKTEHLLGYFTRYGDGASDLEPIQHLFKTQVFELAKYLRVPDSIIEKKPSANLWEGQTDEGEFGFTYRQADGVLSEIREGKGVIREYKGMIGGGKGRIREKIMERVRRNRFKKEVPYTLKI